MDAVALHCELEQFEILQNHVAKVKERHAELLRMLTKQTDANWALRQQLEEKETQLAEAHQAIGTLREDMKIRDSEIQALQEQLKWQLRTYHFQNEGCSQQSRKTEVVTSAEIKEHTEFNECSDTNKSLDVHAVSLPQDQEMFHHEEVEHHQTDVQLKRTVKEEKMEDDAHLDGAAIIHPTLLRVQRSASQDSPNTSGQLYMWYGGSRSAHATMTEYGAFASWKYKHHFSNFRPKSGKSFTVECLLCLPLTKTLSASKDTTSNLKKHLERKHAAVYKTSQPKRILLDDPSTSSSEVQEERPLKQQKMDTAPHPCSQNKVNGLILRFVVEDVQSFSVVELPAFQDLVEGISGGRKVMCRKGLAARVEKAFQKMKEVLKEKLSEVKYVCTTADVWTARGRSFFAVTCHWIEEEDLVRRSAALACARIKGPLTYAVVAAKLQEIHAEYSIGGKVQCTFTDNGSAFVKAFGEFSRDEEDGNEEGSLSFEDLGVALDNGGDERPEPRFFLPPHMRCASQTLSLIASEDLKRAMSQEATRKLYLGSMAKCSAVWTRARASGQIWEGIGNTKPFVPAAARWSSEFAAVHRIASLAETRLKEVCEGLGLPTFQHHEMSFLREHVDVLRPLAVALELLQDEQKCFLGLVLPTLLTLKRKLSEKQPHVRFHANVIRAITDAIDSRFKDLFSSHDAQIATATLPQFRLWWLSGEDEKNVRKALLSEASHMAPRTHDSAAPACSESPEEDFFSFGPGSKSGPQRNAQDELARYLESCNKNLDSLTNFPTVKEIFLKYNMALPSGATVERLCVRGGDPFTPNRCRLSDVHFEQVLLLRYNGPISSLLLEE